MSTMASQITSLVIVYSKSRSKKTSKLRDTGLCEGNSPATGEFPTERASNAENVSIWFYDVIILPLQLFVSDDSARPPNDGQEQR